MTDETEINLNNKNSANMVETLILEIQTGTYYTVYQIYMHRSCLSGSLISWLTYGNWMEYVYKPLLPDFFSSGSENARPQEMK